MSEQTPDPAKTSSTQGQDLMAKLKAPMTVTLPTWAFGAAGLVGFLLLIAALD
ncbi:hypothetical protein [Dinoroseobacter sp. S124A]|uniref:hypothetical protein n=1 Tax=Dinoroseobacter sp. S124A TaxID=3415128 RepID=UPI003C7E83E4